MFMKKHLNDPDYQNILKYHYYIVYYDTIFFIFFIAAILKMPLYVFQNGGIYWCVWICA